MKVTNEQHEAAMRRRYPPQKQPRYLQRGSLGVTISNDPECEGNFLLNGEVGGDEWQLDVGAECNRLLEVAEAIESGKWQAEGGCRPFDAADAKAIRSIVRRVADFEGLETEES